jgi:hypothetical protein
MILLAHERVRLICYCLLFWSRVFRLMAPQEPQKKEGLLYPLKIVQYFELPSGIVKRRYFWNYFFVSENEVDKVNLRLTKPPCYQRGALEKLGLDSDWNVGIALLGIIEANNTSLGGFDEFYTSISIRCGEELLT